MMKSRSNPKTKDLGEEAAREKCLRLLSRRAHSSAELGTKLRAAGFAAKVTEPVLAGLAESGLLDDEEFARAWVADRKLAGLGRRKLAWELRRKGVGREVIERVLAQDLDDSAELKHATALARRKLRGAMPQGDQLARLRRLLLSRGFAFETVDKVLESLPLGEPESAPGETQDIPRAEGERTG